MKKQILLSALLLSVVASQQSHAAADFFGNLVKKTQGRHVGGTAATLVGLKMTSNKENRLAQVTGVTLVVLGLTAACYNDPWTLAQPLVNKALGLKSQQTVTVELISSLIPALLQATPASELDTVRAQLQSLLTEHKGK